MKVKRDEKSQEVTVVQLTRDQIRNLVERYCRSRELKLSGSWELELVLGDIGVPIVDVREPTF